MLKRAPGFTLIELAIALVIASILSIMVFGFVRQSARVNARVAAAVDYGLALTIAYNQLERDLMAIMVSESSFASYKRLLKKGQGSTPAQPESADKKTDQKADQEEKRKREIPPPFFARARENRLELLFFMTTNRMTRHKVFAPYNSRVVYQLLPDESLPGSFKLVRSESNKLDRPVDDFTKGDVRGHVLLSRIRELSIKLFVPEEQKTEQNLSGKKSDGKEPEKPAQEPKKIVYKELTSWTPEELKKAPYLVPAYIQLSGIRAELDGKGARPFTFAFKIPVFEWQYTRLKGIAESLKKAPKKAPAAKEGAGGDDKQKLTVGKKTKPSLARPSLARPQAGRPQPGRPQGRGRQ